MDVKIGEYRMSDFGLRLLSVELGAAAVDTNTLEIPGMNGAIDLTEAVSGYPFYKNAKHKLTFDFMDGSHDTWVWKASSLKGKIHGRRFPVVLGRDSFYYDARISVDTAKLNQAYSQLVVELDASPYKLALRSSVEDWEWDSFNFETDVIREYKNITVPARLDVIGGVMPAGCVFDIRVRVFAGEHQAFVRIEGHHTNVVRIEKDGKKVQNKQTEPHVDIRQTDRGVLSVRGCIEFADSVRINDIREPIERQIEYNAAIADEGLRGDYGAQIGKVLLASFGNNVQNRAKAYAAAGSDARMNGCNLPVVIVSGSGNQGITASLPIVVYAREHNAPHEKLLRAVALSDLLTVHLKTGIGRLSAYCGAVSAGAGAGAGVCYLLGGGFDEIAHTLVNALAIDSGMICDGAKSSCAAKVAAAVEAGLTGMEMYRHGTQFFGGDGILTKGVEETIGNVCELARVGMRETDEEIIRLMLK